MPEDAIGDDAIKILVAKQFDWSGKKEKCVHDTFPESIYCVCAGGAVQSDRIAVRGQTVVPLAHVHDDWQRVSENCVMLIYVLLDYVW